MQVALPWFVLAVATTLINGLALGYIAWREGHPALRLWAWAWLSWACAALSLTLIGDGAVHPLYAIACGCFWVVSALWFLRGSYAFVGRNFPRGWYWIALSCAALALVLGVGPNGQTGMIPLVLFQSVGLQVTGALLVFGERRRTGAWLAGVALVLLGLHVLDAPLLASHPQLLAWGFVLATALEMLAALGMLMLYYEQARARLLDAERTLEQARRLEALGRIAGGVAHDFNNLLTVMQGHMDLMRAGEPSGIAQAEHTAAIDRAFARARRLTTQLLVFGRRSPIQAEVIDVRLVVEETLSLLDQVIPKNIRIELRCSPSNYTARMDRALLEQIVLNLVTNARDAIRGSGTIEIELDRVDVPGPELRLRVSDDGVGMDVSTVRRVFEPFFTTKAPGNGTGLGLASVDGAIKQLGGTIRVESELGRGTRFEVSLPWSPATPVVATEQRALEHRGLDILLVDDDEQVRAITRRMLESGGHRVREADDAARALELLASAPSDVVLSDVVMQGSDGWDLRERLSELHPSVLVVQSSSYPLDRSVDPRSVTFIPKPFERTRLLAQLARLAREHQLGARTGGDEGS